MFIRTTERDPTLEQFRQEVRSFCERELPAETQRKQELGQHIDRTRQAYESAAIVLEGSVTA